jgi:NADPH:quinone reductase-like Zn-dependent oxidoreductase
MMKAVVYEKYGAPDVLTLREIPRPIPKANEVLIKIVATSVTAGDWRMRKADPFLARLFNGLFRPGRIKVLGFEIAGVVEEAGKDVRTFKYGDAVFAGCGLRFGGYAEYSCLPEKLVAHKPSRLSFEEAATLPVGGVTALRFLRQCGLKAGNTILIYGASGSVGTYAIQIAKHLGAEVTGVCSTTNIDLIKSLGCDKAIDYTKENLSDGGRFDVVFDAVGKLPRSIRSSLLAKNGKFMSVWFSPKEDHKDLVVLKDLVDAGKVKPVIDRTFTLQTIREAHVYVEAFRKKGNVADV